MLVAARFVRLCSALTLVCLAAACGVADAPPRQRGSPSTDASADAPSSLGEYTWDAPAMGLVRPDIVPVAQGPSLPDGEGEGPGEEPIVCPGEPTPPILDLDVVLPTPTSVTLLWNTVGVHDCTFDEGRGAAPTAAGDMGARTFATNIPGPQTFTLTCLGADGQPVSQSRTVQWGDVASVQDLAGVRALVGSLLSCNDDFITNYENDELRFVTGNFELVGDPLGPPVLVSFPTLERIGGNLVLVNAPGVLAWAFDALTGVGLGVDITGNDALAVLRFPLLRAMDPASNFAVQWNEQLSCREIDNVWCRLETRGTPVVGDNAAPACCFTCP